MCIPAAGVYRLAAVARSCASQQLGFTDYCYTQFSIPAAGVYRLLLHTAVHRSSWGLQTTVAHSCASQQLGLTDYCCTLLSIPAAGVYRLLLHTAVHPSSWGLQTTVAHSCASQQLGVYRLLFHREGRGATVHKRGRKYQRDWLYLQSINSIKHQWRRHIGFCVFIFPSFMVWLILCIRISQLASKV